MKTKIIGKFEYMKETVQKGKSFEEIEIPNGWQLWEASDFEKFSKQDWIDLNLEDDWFFIKQFSKYWEEKGRVARFVADSGGANLDCDGYPSYRFSDLGVRFKRLALNDEELKKEKAKQKKIEKLKKEHQKELDKLGKDFEKRLKELELN